MSRQYSPRSFFRHAPNAMLKRYFAKHGVLTEYDFGAITETKIEPIYQAWLSLPDTQRGEMERDFNDSRRSYEGGVKAIIDEAEWHDENLADILSEHGDFQTKAFWVFLERPKYWPAASAFCRADAISSSQWNECRTINHSAAQVDDAGIRNLEKVLSHYFHNKEGRGRNCTVGTLPTRKAGLFLCLPGRLCPCQHRMGGANIQEFGPLHPPCSTQPQCHL
ncbi:MAG: hypothetical protein IPJ50_01090 [Betaproteobacteria bacterium]|nr:hypothetical protein [Betaproteobacteria bacterium]